MDSATRDLIFIRINEIVFDEEKIATCMSLAAELKISANDLKIIMQTFINDHKDTPSNLLATYMICGSLKNGNGLGVHIVQETKLNNHRTLFNNISSEFVYSIQKGKSVDFGAIALADPLLATWEGMVVSKNCVKRNIVKKLITPEPASSKATPTKPSSKPFTSDQQGNDQPIINKQTHTQTIKKETKPKQNGGIANFLSKMPAKTNKKVKQEETKSSPELKELKSEPEIQDVEMEDVSETKENKSQKKTESKKRKKESHNNQPNKKRKRIQVCDSDSDDIFDDEESEGIVEQSDEEPIRVPEVKPVVPKNKTRKTIDKTYVDEEGFIVTNTEYVYESASEDENKVPAKIDTPPKKVLRENKTEEVGSVKTKPNASKRKNSKKPVSGKQCTIMNFFKKT